MVVAAKAGEGQEDALFIDVPDELAPGSMVARGGLPGPAHMSNGHIPPGNGMFVPDDEVLEKVLEASPAFGMPGNEKKVRVSVPWASLTSLDLSAADAALAPFTDAATRAPTQAALDLDLAFDLDIQRQPGDPREACEIPEVRLWFVRLDARYPWLPAFLDWRGGELSRFAAMLIPHRISTQDGLLYNDEALEIWLFSKTFTMFPVLRDLLPDTAQPDARLKGMAAMLGYEISDDFYSIIRDQ